MKDKPVDRQALIERIEWMLTQEWEDTEDALLTLLDFLTGWCGSRMKL